MANSLKARLKAGEKALGAWTLSDSADNAEVLALSGVDFVMMDQEHGQGQLADAIAQMRAMAATKCVPMVRVPWNDFVYIKRVLDAGVQGVMVPQINTPEEARAVVAACRYPPLGNRGAAGGTRAAAYGFDMGYYARAAEDLIIVVQIETPQAVENAGAIAAVEGIDVVFIGPRDLSAAIGKLNQFDDPELKQLLAKAEQAVLKSGKTLGCVANPGPAVKQMFDRGYGFLISGSDLAHLRNGVMQMLKEAGR